MNVNLTKLPNRVCCLACGWLGHPDELDTVVMGCPECEGGGCENCVVDACPTCRATDLEWAHTLDQVLSALGPTP